MNVVSCTFTHASSSVSLIFDRISFSLRSTWGEFVNYVCLFIGYSGKSNKFCRCFYRLLIYVTIERWQLNLTMVNSPNWRLVPKTGLLTMDDSDNEWQESFESLPEESSCSIKFEITQTCTKRPTRAKIQQPTSGTSIEDLVLDLSSTPMYRESIYESSTIGCCASPPPFSMADNPFVELPILASPVADMVVTTSALWGGAAACQQVSADSGLASYDSWSHGTSHQLEPVLMPPGHSALPGAEHQLLLPVSVPHSVQSHQQPFYPAHQMSPPANVYAPADAAVRYPTQPPHRFAALNRLQHAPNDGSQLVGTIQSSSTYSLPIPPPPPYTRASSMTTYLTSTTTTTRTDRSKRHSIQNGATARRDSFNGRVDAQLLRLRARCEQAIMNGETEHITLVPVKKRKQVCRSQRIPPEQRIHRCTVDRCEAKFSRTDELQRHIRIHTGIKAYRCEFAGCDKAFLRSDHLKTHIRTHTGEKPYECKCGRRFARSDECKRHARTHDKERTNAATSSTAYSMNNQSVSSNQSPPIADVQYYQS